MTVAAAFAAVAALYLAHLVVRLALAWRCLARHRGAAASPLAPTMASVVVVQPILGGDPDLEPCLRANLEGNPAARFLWLVDEDDPQGREIAVRLADAYAGDDGRVQVVVGPPPADGENPKLAKLARALPMVGDEAVLVVLDDDTTIDAGELSRLTAALADADLVTGLPVFVADRTPWERLVGGFVNGNALLTYLPATALGAQRTINGMIYAARASALREVGGFATVLGVLTDDYAVARLFADGGRRVCQLPAFVRVTMTIRVAAHCGRVMRRWLIFANHYLRENLGVPTLLLVALPALLSTAALVLALAGGVVTTALWLGCLLVKGAVDRWLLLRWAFRPGRSGHASAMVYDVLSELVLPAFYVSTWVRPRRLRWRSRRIALSGGTIHYR